MEGVSAFHIFSLISAGAGFWQLLAEGFAAALILMIMAYTFAALGEERKRTEHLS